MRRLVLIACSLSMALASLVFANPAVAATITNGVHPGQAFVGRVNGSFSHATVIVLCPGPITVGGTGHPAPNQTLQVLSPLPPVSAGTKVSVGLTGTLGKTIVARFTSDRSIPTTFHNYFVNKPIPTGLELPCYGNGRVVFRPTPTSPSARSSVVAVTFESLGV